MSQFFVRLGALGEIHVADGSGRFERGRRVILRTPRGVELAEVIGSSAGHRKFLSHRILRATTEQDEILIRRLDRHKRAAVERCRQEMVRAGCKATLLDVDQLFDGGTLVMHFLGPVDDAAEEITKRIAADYESVVRSRHLAKLLHEGCGPECGENEGGCDSGGGCGSCAARVACHSQADD